MPSSFNSPIEAMDALLDLMGRGVTPSVAGASAAAPAAGAVIADSGPMAAGVYRLEGALGFSGVAAAGKHVALEHRNAANAATLFTLIVCPAGVVDSYLFQRYVLAANERIRVLNGIIGAAGEVAQGSIILTLLPA